MLLSFVYIQAHKIMDYLLHVGAYIFTREDARNIYKFYSVENLTLWQIKEHHYPMANLREIGVAITHGEMDLPKNQMPRFTFNNNDGSLMWYRNMELDEYVDEYNIGQPSLIWHRKREGQGKHVKCKKVSL